MDIKLTGALNVYKVNSAEGTAGVKAVINAKKADEGRDVFTMSTQAEDYRLAYAAVMEAPEVRSAVVNAIKAKIESGLYDFSAVETAKKMIGSAEHYYG